MSFCLACGGAQVPHARDCQRRPQDFNRAPSCVFCRYDRGKHAPSCEWIALLHRVAELGELERVLDARIRAILKEKHGISENPEPDTQRSGPIFNTDGLSERSIQSLDFWGNLEADYACRAHAHASAAEPERSEAAGAVPAGGEPGRAEGPGAGDGRADQGGDREPTPEE